MQKLYLEIVNSPEVAIVPLLLIFTSLRILSSCLEVAGAHAEDPTGFARKCQSILDLVITDLAANAHIFMNAVDPKDVPDYYNIVKTPMDLTTIKDKLAAGAYSKGTEFADVSTHWGNAFAVFFGCSLVRSFIVPVYFMGYRGMPAEVLISIFSLMSHT